MQQILLTRLGVTVDTCRSMVYSHKNKPNTKIMSKLFKFQLDIN